MRLFALDADNTITAFPADEQVPEGQLQFASEKELTKLTVDWSADRLVQVWNNFAGAVPFDDLKPVKKFTDRKTAVARIWKAIQRLDATPAPRAATVVPMGMRSRKAATAGPTAAVAREGSKKAIVLDMLKRPDGATLAEIMAATGWLAHSVRGFISGSLTKRMGLTVESSKRADGARFYRTA